MDAPAGSPASKGAGFTTVLAVLRERVPAPRFDAFVASLPAGTAALVHAPPLAVAWLPIEHFYAVVAGAQRTLFDDSPEGVVELGYRSIGRDLNLLYRVLVRVSSVEAMLSRAARLWDTYNRNHGAISVQMRSRTVADVTYEGIPPHAPAAFWAYQRGALRAVVEATGLRNARVRVLVPPKGAAPCVVLRISADRELEP